MKWWELRVLYRWVLPWAHRLSASSAPCCLLRILLEAHIFPRSSFLKRDYVERVQTVPSFPFADMWLPSKGYSLRACPDHFPGTVPERDGPTLTSGRRDRLRHTLVRHSGKKRNV